MSKLGGNHDETWWREHLNVDHYFSFFAGNRLTGNIDLREGANHYLYHAPDGRWSPIPWDLDMMLAPRRHQSGHVEQERCLGNPVIRREYRNRCRELVDLLLSDATPNGGQVGQLVDEYARLLQPPGMERNWAELDMAKWNFHPRTGEKGGFYKNPAHDDRFGGPWERNLSTPDFAGMCRYVLEYATDSREGDKKWQENDGNPRGFGFGYLKAEAEEPGVPTRPELKYTGPAGFPSDGLQFECSEYRASEGGSAFAAMQWRIGEIAAPGLPGWKEGSARVYEIEPRWQTEPLREFTKTMQIPISAVKPGGTYRARVRFQDDAGRWSRWSEAMQFTAGAVAPPRR